MEDPATPISLTGTAARKILEMRDKDAVASGKPLRLRVRGGGCAGFAYELYFDDFMPDIDQRFTLNGVELVVDSMSLMYLAGTEIDYVEGLMESGFKFSNPNSTSTCGCGNSFST